MSGRPRQGPLPPFRHVSSHAFNVLTLNSLGMGPGDKNTCAHHHRTRGSYIHRRSKGLSYVYDVGRRHPLRVHDRHGPIYLLRQWASSGAFLSYLIYYLKLKTESHFQRWSAAFDCTASWRAHSGIVLSSIITHCSEMDSWRLVTGANDNCIKVQTYP